MTNVGYVWKTGMPHPTTDPRYWRNLAANERALADADRRRKYGTVDSIRTHEEEAKRYDAEAARLESATARRASALAALGQS